MLKSTLIRALRTFAEPSSSSSSTTGVLETGFLLDTLPPRGGPEGALEGGGPPEGLRPGGPLFGGLLVFRGGERALGAGVGAGVERGVLR